MPRVYGSVTALPSSNMMSLRAFISKLKHRLPRPRTELQFDEEQRMLMKKFRRNLAGVTHSTDESAQESTINHEKEQINSVEDVLNNLLRCDPEA